jgi:PAS domain S-box-containing protein
MAREEASPGPETPASADAPQRNVPGFWSQFEDLHHGAALADSDFRLQRVNGVFCRLLGYQAEELVGRSFADVTHPDDLPSNRELLGRLRQREIEQFVVEKRYQIGRAHV